MISFFIDWYRTNLSRPAAIILILQFITIFVILNYFTNVFGTLIAALVFSFMLERPVGFLVKKGVTRLKASILVTMAYVTLIVSMLIIVIPPAAEQLTRISNSISNTISEISKHGNKGDLHKILRENIVQQEQPKNSDSSAEKEESVDVQTPDAENENTNTGNTDAEGSSGTNGSNDHVLSANTTDSVSENAGSNDSDVKNTTKSAVTDTSLNTDVNQNSEVQHATGSNNSKGDETQSQTASPVQYGIPYATVKESENDEYSGYVPQSMNETDKKESTAAMNWLTSKVKILFDKLPSSYKDLVSEKQIQEYTLLLINKTREAVTPFVTQKIAPFFMDAISCIVYLIIVPIFSFYMLKDKDKLLSLTKKYLSSNDEVASFWLEMNMLISKYLNGKCIHIIIIFLVNWIAFSILGLNYALLLAIGCGLSVIIPYIGMIIITIPVVIIGLIQFGLSSDMMWLVALYTILQILDGYALTPMLFSETLNLDPFFILVAIVVFGALFGFWGVVLAIPLATFIKTIFTKWPVNTEYLQQKEEELKKAQSSN